MKKLTKVPMFIAISLVLLTTMSHASPPDESGPNVIRTEAPFGLSQVDMNTGLMVIFGIDVVEYCLGSGFFELVAIQHVDIPDDANRFTSLMKGDDLTTSVWPFTLFDCALFTTVTPLATGTSDLIFTDNDVLIWANPDNRNSNAFGYAAHGVLNSPTGERMHFNFLNRCRWDGDDFNSGGCATKIHLK